MTYELEFHEKALKEWEKLDVPIRRQLKKKLAERLEIPCIESARLRGHPDRFKIKLRGIGYRLVYKVEEHRLVVFVVAIGSREKSKVYIEAKKRD